jgi:signal transduction histidine kinase
VASPELSQAPFRRAAWACGAVVALLGAAALVGWATRQPALLGLSARYIPMAPNTALAFVVLGAGLFAAAGRRRWGPRLAAVGGMVIALLGALRLCEFAAGVDLGVDRWIFRVPAATFGLAPVARMASFTAAAFVAAGAAQALLSWPAGPRFVHDLAGGCALVAGATGLVFSLGYLFSPNAPLLYGTHAIPMALNTALCFVLVGAGTVAAAGPGSFPLRRLCGSTTQAHLLRVFLPLVVGTVGIVAWLTHVVSVAAGASSAAISSAALATAAILLFSLICERVAGRVGGQLERAEAELQRAHDELEIKVEERTRELSRANAELGRAFRELQQTHEALRQAHEELKLTQARMLQQAKMASLGQTAAGVAHEINNPLAFVTNNIDVLRREVGGLHDILVLYQQAEQTLAAYQRELLERIRGLAEEVDLPFVLENLDSLMDRSRAGLKRIQRIVADLRDFARLDEAELKEADLTPGVVATVNLMRGTADQRQVALEADLAPLPALTCDPAKINLVVQNLVSNAIDACPPGGKVIVSARPTGGGVEIEVSDTGCGIEHAIRDKVFDPFFTTKPVGKGTGLGLSMSYGIVKDHGGTIDFTSTPGRGTRFTVRLPPASTLDDHASRVEAGARVVTRES